MGNFLRRTIEIELTKPLRASICDLVKDYQFSTLRWVLKYEDTLFPLLPDLTFESDKEGTLNWLNKDSAEEKVEAVRYALKWLKFSPKKVRNANKSGILEFEVI